MKIKHFILLFTIICCTVFTVNAQRIQAVAWNNFSSTDFLQENEDAISNISTTVVSATSDNQSEYGESGYFELIDNQPEKVKTIGLNIKGNTGAITHCFKFYAYNVSIYNGSTLKVASYPYSKGDKFKIEFTGSEIKYYHNGILKTSYTYTLTNTQNFVIKATLDIPTASFKGVKTTMGASYYVSKPTNKNYIHTITPLKAVSTVSTTAERRSGDFIESVSYFDGLGRQSQTIHARTSPMLRDVVEPIVYDSDGKQSYKYMPYTIKTSGLTKCVESLTPVGDQYNFYTTYYPNDFNQVYIKTDYEDSPLNRVKSITGSGIDWKSNVKKTTYSSTSNSSTIMQIKIDEAVTPVKFYLENSYSINSLFINRVTDEDGKIMEEYKDKDGKLILKRQFIGTKKISTYYVYDDFGLLRLIVQPTGASQLEIIFSALAPNTQSYISDNIFLNNCFYYTYDSKHRITNKYLPGNTIKYPSEYTGSIKTVYNDRNQVILTQDAKLESQKKWQFIKYDQFNRPIITGIYTHPTELTQVLMQNLVDNSTSLAQFESRISTGEGYTTTNSFPTTNLDIQTITYYDDYNYPVISGYTYSTVTGFSNNPFYRTDGQITGQKVKVLGTSNYLYYVNYYNDDGRLIQTKSTNNVVGNDITTTEYDFSGNIILQLFDNTVKLVGGTVTKNYKLQKRYVYDNMNRLVDAYEKVNTEAEVQLSRTTLNELEQIKERNLHITATKPAIQSVDYSYNVRGWLTGINNTDLNDGEGDLFGMKLMYNDLGSYTTGNESKIQYNGNISAIEWYGVYTGTTPFTGKHANVYEYDEMNRLKNSKYYQNVITRNETNNFDFAATYDDNGNFNTMQQKTIDNGLIDNLTYTYLNGGNKLKAVGDVTTDVASRGDFSEISTYEGTTNTEYVYDASGNMIEDKNRNIVIQYNEFNLPTLVTIGTNTIAYQYDALGNRLKKIVNGTSITHFCGEVVYSDADLLFVITSEGRIVKDGSTHRYEYFMQDHLGNTRMVYTDIGANGTVDKIQEDSYFPFGLKMPGFSSATSGTTPTKQLFNGKELQDDIVGFGFYDYGARFYDPALGRWHSVDPLAEKRSWVSPYNFCQNNPINRIDPTGALDFRPWFIDQKTGDAKWLKTDAQAKGKGLDRLGDDNYFGKKGQADVDKWKKEGKTESKNLSEKEVKEKYDYKKVEKSYKLEQTALPTYVMYNDGDGIVAEVKWNIITEKTDVKNTYKPDNSIPVLQISNKIGVIDLPTQKNYRANVDIKWQSGNWIEQLYYNYNDFTPKIVPVN